MKTRTSTAHAVLTIFSIVFTSACGKLTTPTGVTALPTKTPPLQISPTYEPTTAPVKEVSTNVSMNEEGLVELPFGPMVEMPANALYHDDTLTIRYVEPPKDVETGTYEIIGDVFEIDLTNDDVFANVVKVTIPFDPTYLPPHVPEANLFAVFLHDGEWVRVRGDVNEEKNLIIVETLHNGSWSWARDTMDNISVAIREYLGVVESIPLSLEKAKQEEERRYDEFLRSIGRCQLVSRDLEEDINLPEVYQQFLGKAAGEVFRVAALTAKDIAAMGLGSKAAVVFWQGSIPIAAYAGSVTTGLYIGRITGNSILGIRCILLMAEAHARLQEIRAVIQGLEHPDQTSFFPEDAEFITSWVVIQQVAQPGDNPASIDWSLTAHSDVELLEQLEQQAISSAFKIDLPEGVHLMPPVTENLLPTEVELAAWIYDESSFREALTAIALQHDVNIAGEIPPGAPNIFIRAIALESGTTLEDYYNLKTQYRSMNMPDFVAMKVEFTELNNVPAIDSLVRGFSGSGEIWIFERYLIVDGVGWQVAWALPRSLASSFHEMLLEPVLDSFQVIQE